MKKYKRRKSKRHKDISKAKDLSAQLNTFNNQENVAGLRFFNLSDSAKEIDDWRLIGTNDVSNLLWSKISGEVWLADQEMRCFVNSSLPQLIECLKHFHQLFDKKRMTDEESMKVAQAMKQFIAKTDYKASEKNTFWYWTVEEILEMHEEFV